MTNSSIIILGIHDGHNAGAALIQDGNVLAAISEERYTNVKNYSGVPKSSIQKVFQVAKINPIDITAIAIVGLLRTTAPLLDEESKKIRLYRKFGFLLSGHKQTNLYVKFLHIT